MAAGKDSTGIRHFIKTKPFVTVAAKPDGRMQGNVSAYTSEKTDQTKYWVTKVTKVRLYNKDEIHSAFQAAINEFIAGAFVFMVLGKNDAPKPGLKISEKKGSHSPCDVLSRVSYSCAHIADIFKYDVTGHYGKKEVMIPESDALSILKNHSFSGFGASLALKILLNEGDINLANFIVTSLQRNDLDYLQMTSVSIKAETKGKYNIHPIDNEQAFVARRENLFDILEDREKIISAVKFLDIPQYKYIRDALTPLIDMDEVKETIEKIANISDDDIKLIGTQLKKEFADKNIEVDEETSEFIQKRIDYLIEIKKACSQHLELPSETISQPESSLSREKRPRTPSVHESGATEELVGGCVTPKRTFTGRETPPPYEQLAR